MKGGETTIPLIHTHIHEYVYTNILTFIFKEKMNFLDKHLCLLSKIPCVLGLIFVYYIYIKYTTMELIYFILGFLFTVTGYGIVLLYKTQSSHKSLLDELYKSQDLFSKQFEVYNDRNSLLTSEIKQVSEEYNSIQKQLKTDAYEGNTKLNDRITVLSRLFNEQGNRNKQLFDLADKQLRQNQNEIQQCNNTLKKIVDDPTVLARY